jgi:hypothetical protein
MQISQTTEQLRAIARLQANCEIESVNLLSCMVTRAKSGTEFRTPFSAKPALSNVSHSLRSESLVIEVSFEYTAWDSSEPSARLFAVNCNFEVAYRVLGGYTPTNGEISYFSRGTAVFNCWPYARELLRDLTARMGHQAPVLPLLRIVPKKMESSSPEITAPPPTSP